MLTLKYYSNTHTAFLIHRKSQRGGAKEGSVRKEGMRKKERMDFLLGEANTDLVHPQQYELNSLTFLACPHLSLTHLTWAECKYAKLLFKRTAEYNSSFIISLPGNLPYIKLNLSPWIPRVSCWYRMINHTWIKHRKLSVLMMSGAGGLCSSTLKSR